MIAPRRRTDPALPTTRRGAPWERTSDGAIMLVIRVEPAREPASVQAARELARADARLLGHDLDELRHRLGAPGAARGTEMVEQPQPVPDQDPAGRRRRIRVQLVPEKGRAHRSA